MHDTFVAPARRTRFWQAGRILVRSVLYSAIEPLRHRYKATLKFVFIKSFIIRVMEIINPRIW